LGEIVAWLGMALWCSHPAGWCIAVAILFFLAGRAHSTREWCKRKFDETPEDWKLLVPFVY
jgi:hypothetical protein